MALSYYFYFQIHFKLHFDDQHLSVNIADQLLVPDKKERTLSQPARRIMCFYHIITSTLKKT